MKNIFRLLLWVTVVTIPVISGYAQGKGNLSGVVKDDMGETLPGAAIIVKGTTQGTATDLLVNHKMNFFGGRMFAC